ncbi:MAG: ABC transporter ATP-binding protein/permease [Chloroflexota bacterium]|nr:ABC transporter ATP-binding protein/permease [Chloroflexota bacterium]
MLDQHSVRYLVRRLVRHAWDTPLLASGAVASILLSIGFSLLQPLLIRSLINNGIAAGEHRRLIEVSVAIMVVAILSAVTTYFRSVTTQWIGEKVSYQLRNRLFRHLEALSFSFYDASQTGQLLSRLTEDIRNIRRFYSPAFRVLLQTSVLVLGSAAIMFTLNWRLALLSLAIVPVLLCVTLVFGARVRPRYLRAQQQYGQAMNVLQENLAGMRLVRAFGRENFESRKFATAGMTYYNRQMDAAKLSVLANANMPMITGVGTAVVIGVGGLQVIHGQMQVGTLLAFYLYLTQLTDPIRQIGSIVNNVALAFASTERIYEVLERRPRILTPPDAYRPTEVRGDVVFDAVRFAYSRESRDVLRGVSIVAPPGSVVALVGATGSGKSSIIQLLARFYDVNAGSVRVDGIDVRQWDLPTLRGNVGFVLQETFLFSDSIHENIAYGRPDATRAEVIAAAQAAQAHNFIARLPEGYDTLLGERGVNLSGGQKQRVAIARALLLNPRILVLDDATSSVDMETEYEIQQALNILMEGRTTFIIAQRLSSVRTADQICVLDDGEIVERGTHAELLALGGRYRAIYAVQTQSSGVAVTSEQGA